MNLTIKNEQDNFFPENILNEEDDLKIEKPKEN